MNVCSSIWDYAAPSSHGTIRRSRSTLNTGGSVEPREHVDILRRRWLSIVIITLLTLASVSAATLMMPKAYTATARMFVATAGDSVSSLAQESKKQTALYAELATSPRVLDQVVEQLDLDTTADQLADSIEATVPVDTPIIEVAVTDPDPRQAANIANAVGTELAKAAGELTPSREDGSETVRATMIATAQVPTSPSSLLDRMRRLGR
jgi:tyrosine-protein kinase